MKNDLANVVILRTDRIGEVLLSTIAIDAIKNCYPKSKISFVTSSYSKPLIEDRDDLSEVISVDTRTKTGWFRRSIHLANVLRKLKPDVAIVLNPHKMLHLACFFANIPSRFGYDRKWGFLLTHRIEDERCEGKKHEIEYTLDLLRSVGIEQPASAPRLYVNQKAIEIVNAYLDENGVTGERPIVAVHPGTSNPSKMWPWENYAKFIHDLKTKINCDVVVIGSGDENELSETIINTAEVDALNLAGVFDLKQLTALLSKTSLFVGNDTGPMHMAAALNVPVVAIFGRNIPGVSPKRWGPWGDKNVVLHEDPGCEECLDTVCPYEYKCLKAITVNSVFDAAQKIFLEEK